MSRAVGKAVFLARQINYLPSLQSRCLMQYSTSRTQNERLSMANHHQISMPAYEVKPLLGSNAIQYKFPAARSIHTTSVDLTAATPDDKKKESKAPSKIKQAMTQYGPTVFVVYITVGLVHLSIIYLIIANGVDMVGLLSKVPYIGEKVAESAVGKGASTLTIAYCLHKLNAPFRIGVTLAITPYIVRVLRARKLIKS